jgi:cytochrome c peroxidase
MLHHPRPAPLRRAGLLLAPLLAWALAACSDPSAPRPDDDDPPAPPSLSLLAQLGQRLFEDPALSIRGNQSCASCHAAAWGFKGSGDAQQGGVFQGSIPGRFGERAPLSAAYATPAPVFGYSAAAGGFVGGNFWDGRATGAALGDPAAEQALGPFLNPAEQGLPDAACVVLRVAVSAYAALYREAWGDDDLARIAFPADADAACAVEGTTLPLSPENRERVRVAYERIGRSIAAFEASPAVNAFSSRFDAWLAGRAGLTMQEQMGFMLFQGPARCAVCHPVAGAHPLLTDFGYHNLGTPANPENPAQLRDPAFVDLGLGGPAGAAPGAAQWGLVRTPTLRNVDRRPAPGAVKPLMHNGVFLTLREVVRFYNTRDVLPRCAAGAPRSAWGATCWPAPAVAANINTVDLGNLGLNTMQEEAIVAFLRTLSDGWSGAP